jgi:misacylated tRNA(Ala) deacylase
MTILLFREDAYLKSIAAIVQSVDERGGIILDQTNFYAAAGGQPRDIGTLRFNNKIDGAKSTSVSLAFA